MRVNDHVEGQFPAAPNRSLILTESLAMDRKSSESKSKNCIHTFLPGFGGSCEARSHVIIWQVFLNVNYADFANDFEKIRAIRSFVIFALRFFKEGPIPDLELLLKGE